MRADVLKWPLWDFTCTEPPIVMLHPCRLHSLGCENNYAHHTTDTVFCRPARWILWISMWIPLTSVYDLSVLYWISDGNILLFHQPMAPHSQRQRITDTNKINNALPKCPAQWILKCVCWPENISPGNGHLSTVREQSPATLAACQVFSIIPPPISHAVCDSYVLGFPFINSEWEKDYIFLHGWQCTLLA